MESISAFEIIKIGIGPSSSHTMGPWRAAAMFLKLIPDPPAVESLQVRLYGSLAKTGLGHGTVMAVLMGLSDEDYTQIDPATIKAKVSAIKTGGILPLAGVCQLPFEVGRDFLFNFQMTLPRHANALQFTARLQGGATVEQTYYSLGGGFVVAETDTAQPDCIVTPYPCHSGADLLRNCRELGLGISELTYRNEQAWRTPAEIDHQALALFEEIKACVFRGVRAEGILPGGLQVQRRAGNINRKLLGGGDYATADAWLLAIRRRGHDFETVNKWVSCFALAVNEENASFGRVVTAPTNGAAGVLPAVLLYAWCFVEGFDARCVIRFVLTAGEIGTLFKKNATISAAMGGCQAEIGVSSAMAAAGLAECLGASPAQVLQAAEIAMEHHLGLTCDPVGGLVQIPCIERNTMGAIKAITAAYIALESDPDAAKISLDAVIRTMWQTAQDMNSRYKETAEGGLAINIPVNVAEC